MRRCSGVIQCIDLCGYNFVRCQWNTKLVKVSQESILLARFFNVCRRRETTTTVFAVCLLKEKAMSLTWNLALLRYSGRPVGRVHGASTSAISDTLTWCCTHSLLILWYMEQYWICQISLWQRMYACTYLNHVLISWSLSTMLVSYSSAT